MTKIFSTLSSRKFWVAVLATLAGVAPIVAGSVALTPYTALAAAAPMMLWAAQEAGLDLARILGPFLGGLAGAPAIPAQLQPSNLVPQPGDASQLPLQLPGGGQRVQQLQPVASPMPKVPDGQKGSANALGAILGGLGGGLGAWLARGAPLLAMAIIAGLCAALFTFAAHQAIRDFR